MNRKEKDLQIAKEIKKELKAKLGDSLIKVIFYGSRARGEASRESDLDIFLLMKKSPDLPVERIGKLLKQLTDIFLKTTSLSRR